MNTFYIVKLSELQSDIRQRIYILYIVQCRRSVYNINHFTIYLMHTTCVLCTVPAYTLAQCITHKPHSSYYAVIALTTSARRPYQH